MNVTVIINTYNEKPELLFRAVESYRTQVEKPHIILCTVEDDINIELIKSSYLDCELCILTKEEHGGRGPKGCFVQLNKAIKLIKTEYWCFASSNDYAHQRKLLLELNYLKTRGALVCYSDYILSKGDRMIRIEFPDYNYEKHLVNNFVSDLSLMHISVRDRFLPFRTEFNNYAFWDLWLRIYEAEGKKAFVRNPRATWVYCKSEDSMSVQRKLDPEKIRLAEEDKKRMLATHESYISSPGL